MIEERLEPAKAYEAIRLGVRDAILEALGRPIVGIDSISDRIYDAIKLGVEAAFRNHERS